MKDFFKSILKKMEEAVSGSRSWLQIVSTQPPPPPPLQLVKKLDVNRDKQEAHLSLPHLHTKSTKAEEETHWVLKIV